MSKLDDIVSSVDADWWIDGQASYEEGMDAQRKLKEAIKTLFKELIDASWKEFTSESEPHEIIETLTEKVDEL